MLCKPGIHWNIISCKTRPWHQALLCFNGVYYLTREAAVDRSLICVLAIRPLLLSIWGSVFGQDAELPMAKTLHLLCLFALCTLPKLIVWYIDNFCTSGKWRRQRKRGSRVRLKKYANRPPLPIVLLANVQLLDNKLDKLGGRIFFQCGTKLWCYGFHRDLSRLFDPSNLAIVQEGLSIHC